MPIIQISYNFSISLTKYYVKVNRGEYEFPDFSDYCPICSRENCARFLGLYYRPVVSKEGIYYKDFPISRYKCKKKGNKKIKDITFSLLPHELIPYVKYSICFIFRILNDIYVNNMSEKVALDITSRFCDEEVLCISPATVYNFKCCILKGIDRLGISKLYDEIKDIINTPDRFYRLRLFILYLFGIKHIRSPCEYSYEFYVKHGGYKTNSPFLWGTPYQFRR